MNIVSLSNKQDYLLKEDDKTVLKLRYKNDVHIARVETEKQRRVLFIEDEGLLRTLLVLKNEYGIRIGSLNYDNFSTATGVVDIEGTRFRFAFNPANSQELYIYKRSRKNLIYNCQLPAEDKNSRSTTASLIIAISWYLFLKEEKKANYEFNEAIIL